MRYRIKTKEEFIKDGRWSERKGTPDNWNPEGLMNYLLGETLPEDYKGGSYKDYSREDGSFWIVSEKDIVPLEESLLDKAKRLYPVGTRFVPAHIGDIGKRLTIIEEGVFKTCGDSIYQLVGEKRYLNKSHPLFEKAGDAQWDRLIYYEGKWAEILPEPIEKEDTEFEVGDLVKDSIDSYIESIETGQHSHLIEESKLNKQIQDGKREESNESSRANESDEGSIRRSTTKEESRRLKSGFNKSYRRQGERVEKSHGRRRS